MSNTENATGSDYVLDVLETEDISRVFGVIGEGNAHLIDRMGQRSMAFTQGRHEQAAVKMADGYARATKGLAVCTLTNGPGVTNGATGIACADRDGIPLVVLVGDTGRAGRETSLQYLDHKAFTSPISVYQTRTESAETIPELLHRAFDTAKTRSRPVIVEVPSDIQSGVAPDEQYRPTTRERQRIRPDPDRLDEAAAVLEDAECPAILAGGGAMRSDAAGAVEALAERLGTPVATTYFGRGILPETHPLVSGIAGTFMTPANNQLLWDADAVLVVGAKLSGKATRYGELYKNTELVQIDIDRSAIGIYEEPSVSVVADARAALEELADRVSSVPERTESVQETISSAPSAWEDGFETHPEFIDPREFTVALSEAVPDEAIVTVDSGNNTGFPAVFHTVGAGGRMFVNGNFGSMGYALPAALGAKVAEPDRTVVCYTGDGAFLQVIQEIETGVRLELPIIVAVLNDESYGIIRHRQNLEYGRETGSTYDSPSFVDVAQGFGASAAVVRSTEEMDVVEDYLESDPSTPLVLDVRTNPDVARPGFPPF